MASPPPSDAAVPWLRRWGLRCWRDRCGGRMEWTQTQPCRRDPDRIENLYVQFMRRPGSIAGFMRHTGLELWQK